MGDLLNARCARSYLIRPQLSSSRETYNMASKKYNIVWRILAGIISLLTAFVLARAVIGLSDGLTWAGVGGALLVLVLLPSVAITGRLPAQIERWARLLSNDR